MELPSPSVTCEPQTMSARLSLRGMTSMPTQPMVPDSLSPSHSMLNVPGPGLSGPWKGSAADPF